MDISDVFLIMKLSNWCLMATYKHINIILGTVLCTLCRIWSQVTPYGRARYPVSAAVLASLRAACFRLSKPDGRCAGTFLPLHEQNSALTGRYFVLAEKTGFGHKSLPTVVLATPSQLPCSLRCARHASDFQNLTEGAQAPSFLSTNKIAP
jgi:hypothetical protein